MLSCVRLIDLAATCNRAANLHKLKVKGYNAVMSSSLTHANALKLLSESSHEFHAW